MASRSNPEGASREAARRESEPRQEILRYLGKLVQQTTGKFIGVKSDHPQPYVGDNTDVNYLNPDVSTLKGEL